MLWQKFEKYLLLERSSSAHTCKAYKTDLHDLNSFLLDIGDISVFQPEDLEKIHHRMLRDWMASLMEKGISNRSIARKLSAAKSYFAYLHKSSLIQVNPASRIKVPKFEKKLPSFLKESETEYLLDQMEFPQSFEGVRDKCLLEMLYGCGLRSSEVLALTRAHVDIHSQILRVQGKGNKERDLPFGKHVLAAIQSYLATCAKADIQLQDRFFVRKNGQALYPSLIYNIVNKYLGQASSLTQRSPHVLRHTFATHMLDNGADLNAIKELLGHSSLAATQVYTHNTISKLKSVHSQAHPRAENRES
ncbi:MAG: tyrosine-type recombinase/integrase [Bacteroidota bacterium]